MGYIRVEQSKIILPIDLVKPYIYITLVLKYPLERFLARAGRVREKGKKEKKKTESSPEEQVVQMQKAIPTSPKRLSRFAFFFSAASPAPFPYNTPGPVCWMDLKKRKGLENRGNLLKFGGKNAEAG